jgi:hypothetical protein
MPEHLTIDPQTQERPRAARRPQARRNTPLLLACGVVALIVAGLLAVVLIGGGDDKAKVSGDGFTMNRAAGWSDLPKSTLNSGTSPAIAGLSRKGGGILLIREKGRAPAQFKSFAADLTTQLSKRLPDFQRRSARVIKVNSGNAFFYSYVRRKAGTVHTVTVIPAGKHSYSIDTVTPGGDEQAARQAAQMILSFDAGN